VALSSINLPAISDLQNQNDQQIVLEIAKDSEIAHPVAPKIAEWSLECFAQSARVVS
jgi:hypothetical protein